MKLVSYKEAVALGLPKYFTGKPCSRGHVSERRVSGRCCVICASKIAIDWAKNNKERSNEIIKNWNKNNREKEALRAKEWRKNNPETHKRMVRKWREKNKVYYKSYMAIVANNRRLAKIKRTPPWLTEEDHWMIEQAYELAQIRKNLFGFNWHVDHIVPLQGKTVSGLHVPWNIQVIPAKENLSKSNKFIGV